MKTKYLYIAAMVLISVPSVAQETYEGAAISTEDLNGTARYVGMGGAMEALGADISTIGTNPAGIGLFRRSTANISFGLTSQQDVNDYSHGNKTNMSFDQVGVVYSIRNGRNSFLNFSFNYHKSRNFDQILNAANTLKGSSANRLTSNKDYYNVFKLSYDSQNKIYSSSDLSYSQADDLYENYLLQGQTDGYNADAFDYNKANTGYVGEYDFNVSGNINDRIYLGMTIGINDVHYKNWSTYHESYSSLGNLYYDDYRHITGTGADIKAGVIFRPIESSPFRIGLSIATPTWYDLTSSNYTAIVTNKDNNLTLSNSYDYKFYSPWKFGLSLGHTIGNSLALGASYEYADYTHCDARVDEGDSWDGYNGYVDNSYSDEAMNDNIKQTLKAVSTLKFGLEFKPSPEIAVRFGYNYVSPMYSKSGSKCVDANSYGVSYTSDPSFTNWKSTNRITCGLGYSFDKFTMDIAYQYSSTNGDFYAFTDSDSKPSVSANVAPKTEVSNKRHQLLLTLGYKL